MWDVDWSDVSIEKVGERRARKGIERNSKKEDVQSVHGSTGSRPSSTEERPAMSLFESMGLKRNSMSMKNKRKDTLQPETTKDDGKSRRTSLLAAAVSALGNTNRSSTVSDKSLRLQTTLTEKNIVEDTTTVTSGSWGAPTDRSSKESMLSKSTALTTPSLDFQGEGTMGDVLASEAQKPVRPMSDSMKKSTTTDHNRAVGPVRVASLGNQPTILINNIIPQTPATQNSRSISSLSTELEKSVSDFIDNWYEVIHASDRPIPVSMPEPKQPNEQHPQSQGAVKLPLMAPLPRGPLPEVPNRPPTQPTPRPSRARMLSTLPPSYQPKGYYNPDRWKPPDQWKPKPGSVEEAPIPATEASPVAQEAPLVVPKRRVRLPKDTEAAYAATLRVQALQMELKRMAQATPEVALARLKENWGTVTDPIVYQQLEQEKKRWMLASLYGMEQQIRGGDNTAVTVAGAQPFVQGPDVLSLFDSDSTTSYLAVLHPETSIKHMNSTPIPHLQYPNVQSFPWPVSPSLALEANKFTSVHCLSMPSLLASQEIPQLLQKIYHCLAPQGVLHLVVIDPSPVAHSLGPHMREWLEEHLTTSLEAEFRCITPSRVFPRWLEAAKLDGLNSFTTKNKFQAIPPSQSRHDNGKGKVRAMDPHDQEAMIMGDLRSVVGRMLWQDMWSKNVRAKAWWWEITECVEECIQLGTYWEYSIIQATKNGEDCNGNSHHSSY
ncbi:hypothetical protein QC764_212140 [Podospora pseudoanserina]|uniref:Methyltransferase type 11 domain-containing protein n=1 Tax=Podospora pseudoanserina TaxID=2609844 RepID=A0ABR0IIU7_9PEZI|nr:hypothetical protein QC764_212140 [Podospora pseudoanserina]